MKTIITLIIAVLSSALATSYTGLVTVTDGDTLHMAPQAGITSLLKFRFQGSDAPESQQQCSSAAGEQYACGQAAHAALEAHIAGGLVTCISTGKSSYDRILASCTLTSTGEDLEAWMVQQGYSTAYLFYSHQYAPQQLEAQARKLNLWAGSFQEPYLWRKAHK